MQEGGENWVDFGGNKWIQNAFTMPTGPVYVRLQFDPVEYISSSQYIFDGQTLDSMGFLMHGESLGVSMYSGANFYVHDPHYTSQNVEPHLIEFVFNGENSKMAIAGNRLHHIH